MRQADNKQWTTLIAFMLILFFAAAADSLMDKLGPAKFMAVGLVVLAAAWGMVEVGDRLISEDTPLS